VDAFADCFRELAVFINVHEFCELLLISTYCLPCRVTEGDLLAKVYNIVAAVYLLLGGELSIDNIAGKLNNVNHGLLHLFNHIKEELFVHVAKEGTHLKFLAMNNQNHSKEENVAMNYQWASFICSSIGRPEVLDTLCRDPRLPFLYDPSENA
jgi:hypothetical protein